MDALSNGLNWIGKELEPNFVDMGRGCDCTGISKEDWVRCVNRWDRFKYKDGRHWCPRCLAEAKLIIKPRPPALPGMTTPTASYECNSGRIPHTEPHHYTGNLELFAKYSKNGAKAILLQGDSRNLLDVLEGAQGVIASPPYAQSLRKGKDDSERRRERLIKAGLGKGNRSFADGIVKGKEGGWTASAVDGYSTNPANLGNMREGDVDAVVRACISSPPYAKSLGNGRSGIDWSKQADRETSHPHGWAGENYGQSPGQLAAMAVVSSPPYAGSEVEGTMGGRMGDGSHGKNWRRTKISHASDYGSTPGQLAAMPVAVVSSPPWHGTTPESGDPNYAHKFHGDQSQYADSTLSLHNELTYMSPEWLERRKQEAKRQKNISRLPAAAIDPDYPTFWSAARQIVEQCYQILSPGGVAIFVTKRFVRNKQIVEFSQQWADLCKSCGFVQIEWIKAWLIEDKGTQYTLDGNAEKKEIKRASFFRRLYESKYPENSIDWEDVLVFRKSN